jgi:hypothetical protein
MIWQPSPWRVERNLKDNPACPQYAEMDAA